MNLSKADLTTSEQKVFAAVLLIISLVVLYVALPPLVFLMKNMLLLALFSLPFIIIAIFPQSTWALFKQISLELTRKIISTNPVWHLNRGHEYVLGKIDELKVHVNNVSSIKKKTQYEVQKLIKANEDYERQEQRESNPNTKKIIQRQVGVNQNLINTLLPKIDLAAAQETEMLKLLDVWVVDAQTMKIDIDSLSRQYELMKELNSASNAANAFMRKDTPEMKMFNESLKQTEKAIFDFTSNVESFQRDVMPTLSMASAKSDLLQEDGLKTIEEYRNKRLQKQ